jgi:thymidylate synthase
MKTIIDAHVYVDRIEPYQNASRETYDLPQLDLSQLGDRCSI